MQRYTLLYKYRHFWSILQQFLGVNSLICYQYDESADADIGIDDVAKDVAGNVLENIGTKHCADDDTAETIEIVNSNSCCKETVVGSHASHHYIANEEICLRHRHIVFLRRLTLDEVKHGRRALHAKETAHQSAERSCANLHFLRRWQFYALAKQHEVDTNQDECHTKNTS